MPNLYAGCMTGTSVDALDFAIIDVNAGVNLLWFDQVPFPDGMVSRINSAMHDDRFSMHDALELDRDLGFIYRDSFLSVVPQTYLKDIVGFGLHGQTVYHNPARSITAQLGSPWPLAEALKIPVVDRLRYADIAAGGQGAPLAPIMHQACGMGLGVDYYVVNCGGIANISFIKNHKIAFGYDTGPGNTLIDAYYQSLGLGHFDDKGAFAKSGTLHTALLSEMCHYVYFSRPFPKSTGREGLI